MKVDEQARKALRSLPRERVRAMQIEKLNALLDRVLPHNEYYHRKLAGGPTQLESVDELALLPVTTKPELRAEQRTEPVNATWPAERYVHYHQTSGTSGYPIPVWDTAEDWAWWSDCWQHVLDAAGVQPGERAMMAFSFGPFIGFWSAHAALVDRGVMAVTGGGMSSLARLELIRRTGSTVLLCTPTYALHMVEVAAEHSLNLDRLPIDKVIVAGEPGGSSAATRERIEEVWSAKVTDHGGASEVGAWGFGDPAGRGLHVLETEFIAEFLSAETGEPAQEGELSRMLLTSLGRDGLPIIRYETGDLVRPVWDHGGDCSFVLLDGGILGRADDMMVVRGVNVFPSAIEAILHGFPEVVEHRLTVTREDAMDQLTLEVEDRLEQPERIAKELQLRLGLRVEVRCVPMMSLPRFEGKGRRFVDQRSGADA